MNRTISIMVGKGSVNHNSRKFHAKNTDPERSYLNVEYCNENLQLVYHQLFDDAKQRVANLEGELAQERSFEKRFAAQRMEQENVRLKRENKRFRDILKQHNLLPKNRGMER